MADIPEHVGYFTLLAQFGVGLSDSNDVGEQPDLRIPTARVVCRPITPPNDPVIVFPVDPEDRTIILPLKTIRATVDADGEIIPPIDGEDTPSTDGATPGVRLVAPIQGSVFTTTLSWEITVEVLDGGTVIGTYQRFVNDAQPGDTVDFGRLIATTPSPPVTYGFIIPIAYEYDPDAPVVPSDYRYGIDYLKTPSGKLWKVSE